MGFQEKLKLALATVLPIFFIGKTASAQSFSPYACSTCPTVTSYPVAFNSNEFPQDPAGGTNYTNYIDHTRIFAMNHNVTNVNFQIDSFNLESVYDKLWYWQLASPALPSSSTPPSWAQYLTGSVAANTLFGFTSVVGQNFSSRPFALAFQTDYSVTRPGFSIGHASVCCSSNSGAYTHQMYAGERESGLLMAPNDTVYYTVSYNGNYINASVKKRFAIWGTNPTTQDFDVYVRCNALPSYTIYDGFGRSTDTYELVEMPDDYCNIGTWYIAVHAYGGTGQYNIMVSDGLIVQQQAIRAGAKFNASPAQMTMFANQLELAGRRFYGQTEGQMIIGPTDLYNNVSNCSTGCGGSRCDVCFENVAGTGSCCTADPYVEIFQNYFGYYEGLAHEWGHRYFGVSDEYYTIQPPNPRQGTDVQRCGHTVMALNERFNNNNLCTSLDHGKDKDPDALAIGPPAAWDLAFSNGKFTRTYSRTPDNYDFVSHDMANRFHVTTH